MDWKNTDEIEASFRQIEHSLDVRLEQACVNLVNKGIVLREDSNRSGIGGHSYTSFVWSFHFEKREAFGSEIKRATVQLWYREPIMEGDSQRMEITSVAEIFQIGKQSRLCEVREMFYPIEQFLTMKMDQLILENFAATEQILSKY
jgi:hypothetical protein